MRWCFSRWGGIEFVLRSGCEAGEAESVLFYANTVGSQLQDTRVEHIGRCRHVIDRVETPTPGHGEYEYEISWVPAADGIELTRNVAIDVASHLQLLAEAQESQPEEPGLPLEGNATDAGYP